MKRSVKMGCTTCIGNDYGVQCKYWSQYTYPSPKAWRMLSHLNSLTLTLKRIKTLQRKLSIEIRIFYIKFDCSKALFTMADTKNMSALKFICHTDPGLAQAISKKSNMMISSTIITTVQLNFLVVQVPKPFLKEFKDCYRSHPSLLDV